MLFTHPTRALARSLIAATTMTIALAGYTASVCADERDPVAEDIHETVVQVPMTEHGLFGEHTRELVATTYMPDGAGPFPLIVLSHGSPPNARDRFKVGRFRKLAQIREFVSLGFAVIVPIRRGYGATGGEYAEGTGSCQNPDFEGAGQAAAQDLLAAIAFADKLPQVDRDKVVLVGQSAGGFASLAAASYAPKGLVAVLNFSGGRGGDPSRHPGQPCGPEKMAQTLAHFASTTQVPVLWHYVENDQYFAPEVVKTWFSAFEAAGGHGQLVYEPPFGRDGHGMFSVDRSIPIWLPHVEQFLGPIVTLKQSASPTPPAPTARAAGPDPTP
ncbi:alpha/beta fold hydrolase [Paraburkholderia xenovorans]|uniref:alpha/beta hydrolase family protein n=1 Tax=Paraburkholderia xenovorans TaxID=36873 RepID=UPI0038B6F199